MRKPVILAVAVAMMSLWTGCQSSTPTGPATQAGEPAKPAPPADEAYTGRMAFQRLLATARLWSPDAQPFRLQSGLTREDHGQGGKTSVWQAGFASASKSAIKTFTWSGSHSSDAPEFGISPSPEDSYSPSNSSTQVFDMSYLKIDSDQAYKVAQEHGGAALIAKNPQQPVDYLLDWDSAKSRLLWHVIYGTGPTDAKLRVAVNATTGTFVRLEE